MTGARDIMSYVPKAQGARRLPQHGARAQTRKAHGRQGASRGGQNEAGAKQGAP